jgi:hypothetical protein
MIFFEAHYRVLHSITLFKAENFKKTRNNRLEEAFRMSIGQRILTIGSDMIAI